MMQVSELGLRTPTDSEQEAYIDAQGIVIGLAPYLAPIASQVRLSVAENLPQAYIDSGWRIVVPTAALTGSQVEYLPSMVMREILRIATLQPERTKRSGMTNEQLTRLAFDLEINEHLHALQPVIQLNPEADKRPEDYNQPDYSTAEELYSALRTPENQDNNSVGDDSTPETPEEEPETPESDERESGNESQESENFVDEKTLEAALDQLGVQKLPDMDKTLAQQNMQALARLEAINNRRHQQAGGKLLDWILEETESDKPNWKSELTAVVRLAASQRSRGSMRRTYRSYNRLNGVMGGKIIYPTRLNSKPAIYVGIDTSSSMLEKGDLNSAVTHLADILETVSGLADIYSISIDADIHTVQKLLTMNDLTLYGGGGTELAPFFDELNSYEQGGNRNAGKPANLAILVTDGEADWNQVKLKLAEHHTYRTVILTTKPLEETKRAALEQVMSNLPVTTQPKIIEVTP
jgi:predicted metal-dependent peptidase